jgi:hypothetical protein
MSVERSDDAPVRSTPDGEPPESGRRLASVVVRYDGTPDRRTLYPPEADEEARLTRWISANDSSFVRLDERR